MFDKLQLLKFDFLNNASCYAKSLKNILCKYCLYINHIIDIFFEFIYIFNSDFECYSKRLQKYEFNLFQR